MFYSIFLSNTNLKKYVTWTYNGTITLLVSIYQPFFVVFFNYYFIDFLFYFSLSSNIKEWMNLLIKIPLLTSNPMPILSSAFATGNWSKSPRLFVLDIIHSSFLKVIRLRGKTFTGELLDDSTFNSFLFVNVKKCFFNDFFTKNGASYLTGRVIDI